MAPSSPLVTRGARRILAYDHAVFDRYARRIRRMPDVDAFRDRGIGHGSLHATLVHILNVRDAWINFAIRLHSRDPDVFFGATDRQPTDWPGFRRYALRVRRAETEVGRSLSDATLRRPVSVPWTRRPISAGDGILQASYEQAHHLGEIIGAFWVGDLEPPEMTWKDVTRGLP